MQQTFLACLLTLAAAAPPFPADRFQALVRQGAPTALVVEEIDRLMTTEPGCPTATLLVEVLPEVLAAPGGARVLLRVARHLEDLGCPDAEGTRLRDLIRRQAAELGILDAYLRLARPRTESAPAEPAPAAGLRLRVQAGFRVIGGLRASLSPSGRYFAAGSMQEGGNITIWDLHTGYEQRSLSQPLTFLSAFLSEQSLLVAGMGGVSLWDFTTGRQVVLIPGFLEVPTFLAVSPDRRFVALNDRRGRLQVFRVTGTDGAAPGLAVHASLEGERVQTGVFTGDGHLLLGTADWRLLDFDLERRQVSATRFVGDRDDIPTEVTGDLSFEALRVLEGGLFGVRHIAMSPDASHLAVTTNRQVVLLSRKPGELTRERDLTAEPAYSNALFVGHELVVWSHRTALVFSSGDPRQDPRPGPEEIQAARWGAVLAGSTALFAGPDGLLIYDFQRRTAHPRSVQAAPQDLGLGTWLLDDGLLFLYSPEEGLQEVNLWNVREAIAGGESAQVRTVYRGGLLSATPPPYLQGLSRYRDHLYWVEFHDRPFLVVLSPSNHPPLRLVSYHPLPPTVEPIPSAWGSKTAFTEQIAPFRTLSSMDIPMRMDIDMEGMGRGPFADMILTLKGYERVAFDGSTVAAATEAGIEVLPVAGGEAWRIPRSGAGTKVAFHPAHPGLLAVWAEDGTLEAWDVVKQRRLWQVALPPELPRRLLFDWTGRLMVLASRRTVTVVESGSGRVALRHAFSRGSNVFGLAIDKASSRVLITGDFEGKDLALVDLGTSKVQAFLVGGAFGLFSEAAFWGEERPGILELNVSTPELGLYRVEGDQVRKALSFAFFDAGEAVAFDPTNRFWSTLEGGRHVAVDYGPYVGSLEQLGTESGFQDPGAVLAALNGKATAPPPRAPAPPQVFVLDEGLSPFSRRALDGGRLTVRLAVRGQAPVKELRVYVNGVRHLTLPATHEVTVDGLGLGHNEVSFVAVDTAHNVSLPATFPVLVRTSAEPLPRLFFLGIGADDGSLQGIPDSNARALADRFATLPRGTIWSEVDSRVQVDAEATRGEIQMALQRVRDRSSPRDLLVLYLAGHGRRGAGPSSWVFVTSDGQLSLDHLGEWLRQVPARVLLLLDTCYGGEIDPLAPLGHDAMTARLLSRRDTGIAVLAASKSWQPTWAWPESRRSTFAAALEQAFQPETDLDQDGVVSLRELQLVVGAHAESLARTEFQKRMDRLRKLAAEGAFLLKTRDHGMPIALDHDKTLWEYFQYPHRPWLHGLEVLGDIPLLPLTLQDLKENGR